MTKFKINFFSCECLDQISFEADQKTLLDILYSINHFGCIDAIHIYQDGLLIIKALKSFENFMMIDCSTLKCDKLPKISLASWVKKYLSVFETYEI